MEVKVGDVKRIWGRKVTVIEILEDYWFTVKYNNGRFGVCSKQDFDDAEDMEPQLSDLEIVQKALIKSNAGSIELSAQGDWTLIGCRGNHITTGGDCQSLLAWAKQTMSDSKDSTV